MSTMHYFANDMSGPPTEELVKTAVNWVLLDLGRRRLVSRWR